jgi:F-type H+-transporting ATPase subunit delta
MKNQVLIKRYCQGLLDSIRSEEEYASLTDELHSLAGLLNEQKDLADILLTPFIPASRKKKITAEVLSKLSLQPKAVRFILLLVEKERLGLFPDIIALLPDMWNASRGVSTIEVLSVVTLTESQKKALQEKLERIEQRPVALNYRLDGSLIGGLALRKGNVEYDVSLKGGLEKLREKIIEG